MCPTWDPEPFRQRMRERRYQEALDHPPECCGTLDLIVRLPRRAVRILV